MTISYKKSSNGDYYTDCMTAKDGLENAEGKARGVDDYYAGSSKEPPGQWIIHGRDEWLGLKDGKVFGSDDLTSDVEAFHNIIKGYNPETGEELIELEKAKGQAGEKKKTHVGLIDFTFSADKSISVVWSQLKGEEHSKMERDHTAAAAYGWRFLASKMMSRQGAQGRIQLPAKTVIGSLFSHGSSRENDCQLHVHALFLNALERQDGKTGAINEAPLLKWQGAAASLYHAHHAWSLRQQGFEIEIKGKLFQIKGVPEHVKAHFSRARMKINEWAEKEAKRLGLTKDQIESQRGLIDRGALEIRNQKNELTREQLMADWIVRGAAIGFTEKEVRELLTAAAEFQPLTAEELRAEAIVAVQKIHDTDSVFTEPALLTAVAVQLMGKAHPDQIMEQVEALKQSMLLQAESVNDKGEVHTVFTTREMLATEARMLEYAQRRGGKHVLKDFKISEKLAQEQKNALVSCATDPNAVTVVIGDAGAGKTFTMEMVAAEYASNGYKVQGIASAWTGAKNLRKEAKLGSARAIEGWVRDVRSGKIALDDKTVVIVDEAGMVGSKHMHDILELAKDHDCKVILLGDTKQQKAVAAGDGLRHIVKQNEALGFNTIRLKEIRRQDLPQEREAGQLLFAGEAREGFKTYIERGKVRLFSSAADTHAEMIKVWMQSRAKLEAWAEENKNSEDPKIKARANDALISIYNEHMMIAIDNVSIRDLNARAHEARKQAGELGADSISVRTLLDRSDDKTELSEFTTGDVVAIRKTQKDKNAKTEEEMEEGLIANRDMGVIQSIRDGVITVKTVEGKIVDINIDDKKWQHEKGGLALQHGYGMSAHAAQGLSILCTLSKGSSAQNRASTGVMGTRHKEETTWFFDRSDFYNSWLRNQAAEDWKPLHEFEDSEVMEMIYKTASREAKKETTLDFEEWRSPSGAIVSMQEERATARIEEAAISAEKEVARIQSTSKIQSAPVLRQLPFQSSMEYALARPKPVQPEVVISAANKLAADHNIFKEALLEVVETPENKRFAATVREDGTLAWHARRPDGEIVATYDDAGKQLAGKALSDRYAPILEGSKARVDIVETGLDALRLRSTQIREKREQSTIIISNGRDDALGMPHVRELIENAKVVQRQDRESTHQDFNRSINYQLARPVSKEDFYERTINLSTRDATAGYHKPSAEGLAQGAAAANLADLRKLSGSDLARLETRPQVLLQDHARRELHQQRPGAVDSVRRASDLEARSVRPVERLDNMRKIHKSDPREKVEHVDKHEVKKENDKSAEIARQAAAAEAARQAAERARMR